MRQRPSLEALEDRCLLSFAGPVNYAAGLNPRAVVTGYFNSDNLLDLAVANNSGSTVSIMLGNADGTFQAAHDFDTGAGPVSVAVGDFDGDGKSDLATANAGDVSVLLGNGDGTFDPPANLGVGSDPVSVAVGDFDADGKMDLAVVSNQYVFDGYGYYGNYFHYDSFVNVLVGNGDGTFSGPSVYALGTGYHSSLVVADFNGDSMPDVASTNSDYGTVSVLLNDGAGNLGGLTDFSGYGLAIAAGNVDGDGDTDLVTAGYYSINVLLGDGSGGFTFAHSYSTTGIAESVVLKDFSGDGRLDIAAASYSANEVIVSLGRGDGSFSPLLHAAAGANVRGVAAGDFNGDGWLDAATANYSGNNASVLLNDHAWPAPDAPSVSISDASVTEGNSGTVNATFTVTLSSVYSHAVTVHFATANGSATAGSDYTATSSDLVFAAGETSKPLTIAVIGDRTPEATETFLVNLSTSDAFIADGQGIGSIVDDEPRISINNVSLKEGNGKSTTRFVFTVTLSRPYDQAVTVQFATANGTATVADRDYQAQSGTLTFAPGETTKTISIVVYGDSKKESNETFFVNLSGASSNSEISNASGLATILNDDGPGKRK